MITVSVNNEAKTLSEQTSLSEAIAQWGYGDSKIAVAINGEFIPRSTYADCVIQPNDLIDIVRPVGGG